MATFEVDTFLALVGQDGANHQSAHGGGFYLRAARDYFTVCTGASPSWIRLRGLEMSAYVDSDAVESALLANLGGEVTVQHDQRDGDYRLWRKAFALHDPLG